MDPESGFRRGRGGDACARHRRECDAAAVAAFPTPIKRALAAIEANEAVSSGRCRPQEFSPRQFRLDRDGTRSRPHIWAISSSNARIASA